MDYLWTWGSASKAALQVDKNVCINRHKYILSRAGEVISRPDVSQKVCGMIEDNSNLNLLILAQSGGGEKHSNSEYIRVI